MISVLELFNEGTTKSISSNIAALIKLGRVKGPNQALATAIAHRVSAERYKLVGPNGDGTFFKDLAKKEHDRVRGRA